MLLLNNIRCQKLPIFFNFTVPHEYVTFICHKESTINFLRKYVKYETIVRFFVFFIKK